MDQTDEFARGRIVMGSKDKNRPASRGQTMIAVRGINSGRHQTRGAIPWVRDDKPQGTGITWLIYGLRDGTYLYQKRAMKKIVCLYDFSGTSENAVQYAVSLAMDTESKLLLVARLADKGRRKEVADLSENGGYYSANRLAGMRDQLRSMWKIRCDYAEVADVDNATLSRLGKDIEIIIAGIDSKATTRPNVALHGIDFKSIRKTTLPVLLVPSHFQYKKIGRLLFAYDYEHTPDPPLGALENLAGLLKADVKFLSVVKHKYSEREEEKINRIEASVRSQWGGKRSLNFDSVFYDDVSKCLNHYLDLWQSDDIVVFEPDRGKGLGRLFRKSVIREMSISCDYPIMILPRPRVNATSVATSLASLMA